MMEGKMATILNILDVIMCVLAEIALYALPAIFVGTVIVLIVRATQK